MLLLAVLARADQTVALDGAVPLDGGDFFTVAFEVPEGTAELQISHDDGSEADILDWGLLAPDGSFRGWGGGNTEDAVLTADAASRSYLPGPLPAGTWRVLVGKARIESAEPTWQVEVTTRASATLDPQPERRPYADVDLGGGPRWVAGDFHVHSRESGDASATLDAIATLAEARGLDFVALSEHNTTSVTSLLGDAQDRYPDLLLLPGQELTTYAGHANGIGLTEMVPFAMGFEGADFDATAQAVADAGGLLSINHPVLDLGDLCIGCAWEHPLPARGLLAAVEIATGGWSQTGVLFTEDAIAFWDALCDEGHHLAAMGGSDDHRAGTGTGPFDSPVGDSTTLVYVDTLSRAAILDGIRAGRTVVKLQGPDDPMVELTADPPAEGDTVTGDLTLLRATVTGGLGAELRWVVDGDTREWVTVDADPCVAELRATNPDGRARAELWVDGHPRTVTSHRWFHWAAHPPPEPDCGCGVGGSAGGLVAGALAAALAHRRRRGA